MDALTPERWQRIETVLDAALDLPADQRDAYLRAACGDDATLLAEVRELLEGGERPGGPLEGPAAEFAADLVGVVDPRATPAPLSTLTRIGPWHLVREIGRGGMGTVYLAERGEHFQQRIALKLIRPGLHIDEQMVRRFLDERQILATLEHANIARLLDGGLTVDGVPWFGMEFIDGEPIDRWCDARRLPVEARLELFCTVCDATAYAHGRQIVHRDLKPSNILVRADGVVKLLDFGIAKLVSPDAERETVTRTGQRPLTPEYASPEQLRGEAATPASDVYSLGVLLYELLTGWRPHRVSGRTGTLEQAVLTEDPPRPSAIVRRVDEPTSPGAASTDPQTQAARARATTPDRLSERLRGELDAIMLTALAKDPQQRYVTADVLGSDVRRHLDGLPVMARPRRTLVRRVMVGAAAVLVVGAVGTALWMRSGPAASDAPEPDAPVIAVGFIADYRGAGAPEPARPLADLLGTNLARVPSLRIVSTARLYELMAQLGTSGRADAGAYSAAARRAGATVLIDGSLFAVGDSALRLDLRSIDIATGDVVASQTVSGSDIFALVDSGTARLTARIGGSAPSNSVADVTTRSEVAQRFYEEGLRAFYRGELRAARALFETAVAEDSTRGTAYLYLARATREAGVALRHLERARRFSARAGDRERLTIEATYRLLFSDPGALATADTLAVRYPQELAGDIIAGRALVQAGDYLAALRRLRRAVTVDSVALDGARARCAVCDARGDIVSAYVAIDSSAAALREAHAWTEVEPNRTTPWLLLSAVLQWMNRGEEARAAFRRAAEVDPALRETPSYYSFFVRAGDFQTADRALEEIARTGSPQLQAEANWFLSISLRLQGRFGEALEATRRNRLFFAKLNPDVPSVHFALPEAHVLFENGRYQASVALFDSIASAYDGWPPSYRARFQTWALGHSGNALAAVGDTVRLAARVDSARRTGEGSLSARDRRMHHYLRGLLLAARHDDEGAVTEFRRALYARVGGYTRVNYELARALLRLNRPREAVAALQPTFFDVEGEGLYVTHAQLRDLLAQAWDAAGAPDSAVVHYRAVERAWRAADAPAVRDRVNAVRARLVELERR